MSKTTKTSSKKNLSKTKPKTVSKKKSKKTPSKIFCGITDPIPKGYRLGSMVECLEKNQVRYYGLKKIDSKVLGLASKKKDTETESQLQIKAAGLKGKLTKIKRDLDNSTNLNDKKKLVEEYESTRTQLLLIGEKIKKNKK